MYLKKIVPHNHMVYTITVIGFIYALHLVIPMYSNSSFLNLFADENVVGYIYMLASALTILGFLITPILIRRIGNYTTALWLIVIQIILMISIIKSDSAVHIFIYYVLQSAIVSMIGLCLDIFLEAYTDKNHIGKIRGLYTTTLNASWLIAPLIGSMIINGGDNYKGTYIASLAMLFPLMYLIFKNFPKFHDPKYSHITTHTIVTKIANNKNLRRIVLANLILQTFYSWMVVYSPIYLHKYMGFNWSEIGIIIVVMLLPFVIVQYPLGIVADKKYGEKEIMFVGFLIMGIATILWAFCQTISVIAWALGLLFTRIGAAAAEIMMEVYFFKTIPPKESELLGVFRMTRLIAPMMAVLTAR